MPFSPPFLFLLPETAPAAQQALPPAPAQYSRLKWLRQARSTILARNRMAVPALPALGRGYRGGQGRRSLPQSGPGRAAAMAATAAWPRMCPGWGGAASGGPGSLPLRHRSHSGRERLERLALKCLGAPRNICEKVSKNLFFKPKRALAADTASPWQGPAATLSLMRRW